MSRLSELFRRRSRFRDFSEELRAHLEEKAEELVRGGLSREDAAYGARRAFGNATAIEERGREVLQWTRLESFYADAKFALRQLIKSPAFTATAILTLALGIGANTAIFTLVHALLLQSLPIPEPDRLARIALSVKGGGNAAGGAQEDLPLNLFLIQSIERHAKSFSGVFGWSSYDFVLKEETGLHIYSGAVVSGNTFQVLGVVPAAGRLLTPADDQKGGGPDGWAAVISHRFWVQHYHADASMVGKHVVLTDHSVTIVGVAPEGFEGVVVATHPDFYLPLEYEPVMRGEGSVLRMPGNVWLTAWARVKRGVPMNAAAAEAAALFPIAADETLPAKVRHSPVIEQSTFLLRPGRTGWSILRAQYEKPLLLLQILVGVVLLVCCVNLAGLCLARASTREQEFAIRGALGAARSRLLQQPLIESLLLALAGGAMAVVFAWVIDRYLLQFLADRAASTSLSMRPELSTLLLTGGCAVLCSLCFGMAPAWMASHAPFEAALRRKGQSASTGQGGFSRWIFVPVQVALALVLVVVAGMLSATVLNLRTANLGFHTENVLFVPADFERLPQKGEDLIRLYRRMIARMQQMPGVESVSVAESTPLGEHGEMGVFTGGATSTAAARSDANTYWMNDVGAGYFQTLGTRLLDGRDFSGLDADTDTCILNRSAAATLFPGKAPIGEIVRKTDRNMSLANSTTHNCQVIGVVEDAKYTTLRDAAPPTVYLPFGVNTDRLFSLNFVIHARTFAEGKAAYLNTLHEMAPGSPDLEPVAFAVQFNDAIGKERLLSVLSGFFALLALLLSGIGIYGLMAAYVLRRTTEIGVRMALGATRTNIFSLVMTKAALMMLAGVLAGGCVAWFAARSIQAFLFNVSPGNPGIFVAAISILALSGFVAALLPARRAVSIEPMQALRSE